MFNKVLGKGAYGAVYLGCNFISEAAVAVKKITIKKAKHLQEVECLKQIKHKNIVSLYDYVIE